MNLIQKRKIVSSLFSTTFINVVTNFNEKNYVKRQICEFEKQMYFNNYINNNMVIDDMVNKLKKINPNKENHIELDFMTEKQRYN